jgi:hypothetical protein
LVIGKPFFSKKLNINLLKERKNGSSYKIKVIGKEENKKIGEDFLIYGELPINLIKF